MESRVDSSSGAAEHPCAEFVTAAEIAASQLTAELMSALQNRAMYAENYPELAATYTREAVDAYASEAARIDFVWGIAPNFVWNKVANFVGNSDTRARNYFRGVVARTGLFAQLGAAVRKSSADLIFAMRTDPAQPAQDTAYLTSLAELGSLAAVFVSVSHYPRLVPDPSDAFAREYLATAAAADALTVSAMDAMPVWAALKRMQTE